LNQLFLDHSFIQNIASVVETDPQSAHLQTWSELLYDQALLSEGEVEDPASMVQRLQTLMVQASDAVVKK